MQRIVRHFILGFFLVVGMSLISISVSDYTGSSTDSVYAQQHHKKGRKGGKGGKGGKCGKSVPEPTLIFLTGAALGGFFIYKKASKRKST